MRLALVLLVGCHGAAAPIEPAKPRPRPPEPLFAELPLPDAANGLSGLAADDRGHLWTVAERDPIAYRITPGPTPALARFTVQGIPDDTDLEAIAWLGGDRFALGTEGRVKGRADVLLAHLDGATLVIDQVLTLTSQDAGTDIGANHGAEGICAAGDLIAVAFETAGTTDGKRWAPVVVLERGAVTRRHRVWLTSDTGKLSGLDCRLRDGQLETLAIERHFEVTKLLTFTLSSDDVTPTVALDLGPTLVGRLNLEGIAWLGDDIYAVVDNQWKTVTGPSELLRLRRGSVR